MSPSEGAPSRGLVSCGLKLRNSAQQVLHCLLGTLRRPNGRKMSVCVGDTSCICPPTRPSAHPPRAPNLPSSGSRKSGYPEIVRPSEDREVFAFHRGVEWFRADLSTSSRLIENVGDFQARSRPFLGQAVSRRLGTLSSNLQKKIIQ